MTKNTQTPYDSMAEENARLRRELSAAAHDNIRLKAAFDDALSVLNASRQRLEVVKTVSPYYTDPSGDVQPVTAEGHAPQEASDDVKERSELRVVEYIQFFNVSIKCLSDGTLEANTPGGPLRFEDFAHLREVFTHRWPQQIGL